MRLQQTITAMPGKILRRLRREKRRLVAARLAREYARATRSRKLYYSITVPGHVGFTDQILMFGLLYKLSALLGMKYHFTPLKPKPNLLLSAASHDCVVEDNDAIEYGGIFGFLGFDWYFSRKGQVEAIDSIETLDFELNQALVDDKQINDLQDLINYLRGLIQGALPADGSPLHFRFVIRKQIPALAWLNELPNSLLDFDLADIYRDFRQLYPVPEVFEAGKPRVLIHIRQGDTAVITTPWNTFLQIWPRGRDAFNERATMAEIRDRQVISDADFEKFYADLKQGLETYQLSTLLHSDGFARSFFTMDQHAEKLNFSAGQIEEMKAYRGDYNSRAFAVFDRHHDVKRFVGEELQLLYELMHAFYSADIVIVGTQQRMLAKQYAYSFHEGGGPLLISLYKGKKPFYNYLGNHRMLDSCLYVNLDDYHVSEVVERVRRHLSARYQTVRHGESLLAGSPGT